MLAQKLLTAATAAGGTETLFVDDVFSTFAYSSNASTQTINNGIDLAGKGGLVWLKCRNLARVNGLFDTARGPTNLLQSDSSAGESAAQSTTLTAFGSSGFSLGSDTRFNGGVGNLYVSWTFRRAPKFFDCGTYTGNGVAGRQIPHSLGVAPGMVIVKCASADNGDWAVYHRSTGDNTSLSLNGAGAASSGNFGWVRTASASNFTLGNSSPVNANGAAYVWYAFAHDPSADGIIQCGSFTTDASGNATVTLGWEPQFVTVKLSSSGSDGWWMLDAMRGHVASPGTSSKYLAANSSATEGSWGSVAQPTATGFTFTGLAVNSTFIYLAIRRPNKPPTTGTQVYNAIARTGTGAAATVTGAGFAPDSYVVKGRTGSRSNLFWDRLRGDNRYITSNSADAESFLSSSVSLGQDGVSLSGGDGWNAASAAYINHFFRRAPGVHDQICYSGTGANKTEAHNLGAQPQLWLVKRRDSTGSWTFGSTLLNANEKIVMPAPNGRVTDATAWNSAYPTATNISLGTQGDVNASGGTYAAYLWASLLGVSRVFTYTGNGTSQTVDCGFTAGARFVMIIRTTASTAQDIYIWDSARGIVAANDPRLSLNTAAAEETTLDTIDPSSVGFIVNQDTSNVNVNGAVYIGLAYA